jgi:sporulation protein YlmC with PRC-barrel domain
MKIIIAASALTLLAASLPLTGAQAQGAPQTISAVRVDVQKLATGYRASKIVGTSVVNDANEKIGSVDDLIVNRDDRVLFAVLSVGGFLGMGTHLVAVPYAQLQPGTNHMVLTGGNKEALKALPEFKYASR